MRWGEQRVRAGESWKGLEEEMEEEEEEEEKGLKEEMSDRSQLPTLNPTLTHSPHKQRFHSL